MSKHQNKYMESISIFFKGTKMYFQYIDKFLNYMTFPIFGQLFAIIIIFFITYLYANNLPDLMVKFPIFDNVLVALSLLLLFTVPAFFLFCKAFYEYLITFASLNSIANNLSSKGKAKKLDTKVHSELIKRRSFSYVVMLLVLSLIYAVGLIPFFWVLLLIFMVYSSLTFQVFALEENVGPIGAIKRSFVLIKHNFWATTLLLVLLFLFTYMLVPNIIVWAFEEADIVYYLSNPVEKFVRMLPLDVVSEFFQVYKINYIVEPYEIARNVVTSVISSIVITYTLPLRSCCCTLLYKKFDDEKIEENRKATRIDGRKEIKKIMKKETRITKKPEKEDESK